MLGVADLRADGTAGLPREFHGPLDYSERWFWLALAALALVALYYALVAWLTRDRPAPEEDAPAPPDVRAAHLARIDALEAEVRSGAISAREGHQRLSEVVRSYVEAITPLRATTMALADFRLHAPRPLVEAIEVMYPPEFAPEQDSQAAERFEDALRRGRGVVSTWRR
jgi:hypothetical protein